MKLKKIHLSKKTRWILFFVLCLATAQLTLLASFAEEGLHEEASALENIYQDQSKTVLNQIMNPEDYSIVVTATLHHDAKKLKDYHAAVEKRFLPGLIVSDPIGFGEEHNLLLDLKQKVEVQVVLADEVPKDRDTLIKDLLGSKLHLHPSTGDHISVMRTQRAPATAPNQTEPEMKAESSTKLNTLWIALIFFIGSGAFWLVGRRQKRIATFFEPSPPPMTFEDRAPEKEMKGESPPPVPRKSREELESERDSLEMQLAFSKAELTKLIEEYPSIVCRAAAEFFAQGRVQETAMYFESLGWDNARTLFKDLDTRMWSRVGASLRERDRDPTLDEVFNAVHVFHRFALSFVLERATGDAENPFSFLFHLNDSQLIDLLTQEDASNIALISIFTTGAQMSELLSGLTPAKQNEVILHMTKITHLSEAQIQDSVEALLMRLELIKADPFIHAEGPALAADFMRSLDAIREEELYQTLLDHHPEEAEKLRHVRVLFKDLPYYPSEMVRRVVEAFDSEDLMKTLVGFPEIFVDDILSLLPSTRAQMIKNDLNQMTEPPSPSQRAELRRKLVNKLEIEFEQQRFSLSEFWRHFNAAVMVTPEVRESEFTEIVNESEPITFPDEGEGSGSAA